MRQHILNAAVASAWPCCFPCHPQPLFAEVKKSDLGAACVSQNRIVNGRVARCEIRTGDAVRRHDGEPLPQETACTVGGKLVNPKMDPDREPPKSNMQIPQQDSTARA